MVQVVVVVVFVLYSMLLFPFCLRRRHPRKKWQSFRGLKAKEASATFQKNQGVSSRFHFGLNPHYQNVSVRIPSQI